MKLFIHWSITTILALIAFVFGWYPSLSSLHSLTFDPGLRTGGPNKLAFQIHRTLSKRIPKQVDERIESGIATTLTVDQIEATEWPLYGAFFYLRSTERLQEQWDTIPSLASESPLKTGKEAIDACVRLLLDENQAHWVKLYWGDRYQTAPNNFYRLLVAGGLGAHHRLTGNDEHLEVIRSHLDAIIHHLDESRPALIDDYPGQCFPMDVVAAIGIVHENVDLLSEDHKDWAISTLGRLLQTFPDSLPPYTADSRTGRIQTPTRGCTNGFGLPFITQVDPENGAYYYQKYCDQFWEEGILLSGFREFGKSIETSNFYFDPDSGPVVWSFGTSATGLGLGVTRAHGDHEKASVLAMEMIASCIRLPNGRFLVPALVSNAEHAPYFPEIVLLYQLSQTHLEAEEAGPVPFFFWLITSVELAFGSLLTTIIIRRIRRRGHNPNKSESCAGTRTND